MAEEIAGYVSTATGFCLEFSEFAPGWILVQTIIFLISTALSVFDTYSDWVVVLNFQKLGFSNPLLPMNPHYIRAWYIFAVIGTIFTSASFLNDGVDLLYPMIISFRRYWCKTCWRKIRKSDVHANSIELRGEDETNDEKTKDEEEISDPCKCCYRVGCNVNTRNETLANLALWFQDVPLMSLSILFVIVQFSCNTPDPLDREDNLELFRDVGISVIATVLASIFRLVRSASRVSATIGVRVKNYCCPRFLPKKGNAAYPPDTPAQYFVFPYYCGLFFQVLIINLMALGALLVWVFFIIRTVSPLAFNDSVGIYRRNLVEGNIIRLFNISGDIIPGTNGSFVNLEAIDIGSNLGDIYCLSEFEYRQAEAKIYFNAIELQVVSSEGKFCANFSGNGNDSNNFCRFYYTGDDRLFYGSGVPDNGFKAFDSSCILFINLSFDDAEPIVDFSIIVDERINNTDFPMNGEDLVIYYPPPINVQLDVTFLLNQRLRLFETTFTFQNATSGENITCSLSFNHNFVGNIEYSYRDVYNITEPNCSCSPLSAPAPDCMRVYENLQYAYFSSQTNQFVPLTSCSTIPEEEVKPQLTSNLLISCPCPGQI